MLSALKVSLNADIKWREQEIALLKRAVLRRNQSVEVKSVQRRYSIPAFYAIWEGFVVASFSAYVDELNLRKIRVRKVQRNLLAFNLFKALSLYETPKDYAKRLKLAEKLRVCLDGFCRYSTPIETNSNVDYNELIFLMRRFALDDTGMDAYESQLMKFLHLRNKIAHGTKGVQISEGIVIEFADLVVALMCELRERILNAIRSRHYLEVNWSGE